MSYKVEIHNETFDREFKRLRKKYRSLEKDMAELIEELETNPIVGDSRFVERLVIPHLPSEAMLPRPCRLRAKTLNP